MSDYEEAAAADAFFAPFFPFLAPLRPFFLPTRDFLGFGAADPDAPDFRAISFHSFVLDSE